MRRRSSAASSFSSTETHCAMSTSPRSWTRTAHTAPRSPSRSRRIQTRRGTAGSSRTRSDESPVSPPGATPGARRSLWGSRSPTHPRSTPLTTERRRPRLGASTTGWRPGRGNCGFMRLVVVFTTSGRRPTTSRRIGRWARPRHRRTRVSADDAVWTPPPVSKGRFCGTMSTWARTAG